MVIYVTLFVLFWVIWLGFRTVDFSQVEVTTTTTKNKTTKDFIYTLDYNT